MVSLAAACRLAVNYILIYDFYGSVANVIHPSNPLKLIFRFESFCNTLCLCHLLYQPKKHIFCLPVNIGKITVQLVAGKQGDIQRPAVAFEVSAMPLSTDTNVYLRFLRQFQTGQIVVPLQLISKSVFLVINVLVHFVILQL